MQVGFLMGDITVRFNSAEIWIKYDKITNTPYNYGYNITHLLDLPSGTASPSDGIIFQLNGGIVGT